MKIPQKILTEISQITREIEDKYPELQKYLDELPITLSDDDNKVEKIEKNLKSYIANKIARKIINNFVQ